MAGSPVKRARLLPLVSLLALLPTWAAASPVTVTFNLDLTYFSLRFGSGVNNAWVDSGMTFGGPELDVSGADVTAKWFDIVGGRLAFVSGSLLSVTPTADDAIYQYDGGGSLFASFDLLLPNGRVQTGTFTASLGPLTLTPSVNASLGAGLFDAATAKLLGITPYTTGGTLPRYVDLFDRYPEPYRMEKMFGEMDITAEAPEPPALLLLIAGGIGLTLAGRRRQRRTATPTIRFR